MNRSPSRFRTVSRRGPGQARRGAATVEFAVAAPFLVILLLGMVDIGQLANAGQSVSGASAVGARVASKASIHNAAEVEARIAGYLADRYPALTDTELASALDITVRDLSGTALTDTSLDAIATGDPVSVEVAFQFDSVRWLDGTGLGQGRVLRTTTVVRRE